MSKIRSKIVFLLVLYSLSTLVSNEVFCESISFSEENDPFSGNMQENLDLHIQNLPLGAVPSNMEIEVFVNICSSKESHIFSLPVDSRGVAVKDYEYFFCSKNKIDSTNTGIGYCAKIVISEKSKESFSLDYVINYSEIKGWRTSKKGNYKTLLPIKSDQELSGKLILVLDEWYEILFECTEIVKNEDLNNPTVVKFKLTRPSMTKK